MTERVANPAAILVRCSGPLLRPGSRHADLWTGRAHCAPALPRRRAETPLSALFAMPRPTRAAAGMARHVQRFRADPSFVGGEIVLWTLFVILLIAWLLGLVGVYQI